MNPQIMLFILSLLAEARQKSDRRQVVDARDSFLRPQKDLFPDRGPQGGRRGFRPQPNPFPIKPRRGFNHLVEFFFNPPQKGLAEQRTRIQPVPAVGPPNVRPSEEAIAAAQQPVFPSLQSDRLQRDPLKALPPRDLTRPDPGLLKPEGSVIGPGGLPLDPVFSGLKPEARSDGIERDPLQALKPPRGVLREPLRPGGLPSDLDLSPASGFERQGGLIRSTDPLQETNRARREGFQPPEEPELFQEDQALLDLIESFRQPREGFNPFANSLVTQGLGAQPNFGFGRKRRRNEFLL